MAEPDKLPDHPLKSLLVRSQELQDVLMSLNADLERDESPRATAGRGMCSVAMEHALGVRSLMAACLATSAVGMMRLQFEALTRAMWLIYAADDTSVERVLAPLTPQSEQAAKSLPSVSEMIDQIGKGVGTRAPALAHQQLEQFKKVSWHAMNSYVHGGIHPLRRSSEGFPVDLAANVLRNSNGLMLMTAMVLAAIAGDADVVKAVRQTQLDFVDCLPELLKP